MREKDIKTKPKSTTKAVQNAPKAATRSAKETVKDIKTVAKALRETIGAKADIYRIGGDEFVCISESNILPYISQFKDTISFLNNEKLYKLSVSVGYAPYNEKYSKTIDDMIRYADEKMYKDKKRKK